MPTADIYVEFFSDRDFEVIRGVIDCVVSEGFVAIYQRKIEDADPGQIVSAMYNASDVKEISVRRHDE